MTTTEMLHPDLLGCYKPLALPKGLEVASVGLDPGRWGLPRVLSAADEGVSCGRKRLRIRRDAVPEMNDHAFRKLLRRAGDQRLEVFERLEVIRRLREDLATREARLLAEVIRGRRGARLHRKSSTR